MAASIISIPLQSQRLSVLSTLNELVFSTCNCERNNETWKAKIKFIEKFLLLYFRKIH